MYYFRVKYSKPLTARCSFILLYCMSLLHPSVADDNGYGSSPTLRMKLFFLLMLQNYMSHLRKTPVKKLNLSVTRKKKR